eukprot:scaffold179313_cov33-Tisochrysis_lutea.AAC.2
MVAEARQGKANKAPKHRQGGPGKNTTRRSSLGNARLKCGLPPIASSRSFRCTWRDPPVLHRKRVERRHCCGTQFVSTQDVLSAHPARLPHFVARERRKAIALRGSYLAAIRRPLCVPMQRSTTS